MKSKANDSTFEGNLPSSENVPLKGSAVTVFVLVTLLFVLGCGAPSPERVTSGIDWRDPITVDTGPTVVGPWRMNRSKWDYVDDPSVDLTPSRRTGVAWVNQGHKDVFFQFFDGDGSVRFSEPVNVSRSPDVFSWFPDVVVDSTRDPSRVYVLWQEIVFSGGTHGGEIFFARSDDGGKTFEAPVNLSRSKAGDGKGRLTSRRWDNGSLDLAMGPGGRLFAAWTEYEGRLWFASSKNAGDSFTEPVLVAGGPGDSPARGPSLAPGPSGAVNLAWTVGGTNEANIHYAKLSRDGHFLDEAVVLHPTGGHADGPKIAVSDSGTLHVVWTESPNGRGGIYELRYTRRLPGDTHFRDPRRISPEALESAGSFNFPSLDLDDSGNPYILWELSPSHDRRRSYGLGFVRSTTRGRSFKNPGVVPESIRSEGSFHGSLQGKLADKLDVENNGDIAVTTSTFNPDDSSHVWLYRGTVSK